MSYDRKTFSYDSMYMDFAYRASEQSYAFRKKVGAVIVKESNIVGYGWNGRVAGKPNDCEDVDPNSGLLITRPDVLHAEENAYEKISRSHGTCYGHDGYFTLSPCISCAKIARSNGIKRLVYHEQYRDTAGVDYLYNHGVEIVYLGNTDYQRPVFNVKRTIPDEDLLHFGHPY